VGARADILLRPINMRNRLLGIERGVWLEAEFSTPRRGVAEEDAKFEILLTAKAKPEDPEQARTENFPARRPDQTGRDPE
jgi:hypothetical protein